MADLTRKPPESVQVSSSRELPVPTDLANERHYSIIEISKLWGLSEKTVRKIFEGEPGVIRWGSGERLHKRGYHTLRVPETVLHRVHRKLRKAS
jgi:predicted transcriptional regulator